MPIYWLIDHKENGAKSAALAEFQSWLEPGVPIPVAVMKALTGSIRRSGEDTLMGLEIELRAIADYLKDCGKPYMKGKTAISLDAACELFLRHVTRVSLEYTVIFSSFLSSL